MSLLDDIIGRVNELPPAARGELEKLAMDATRDQVWLPNPGPQHNAAYSEADDVYFGGEAGGGKTDLAVGLALTQHTRSLLLRRFTEDARDMAERAVQILGHDAGLNRSNLEWRLDDGKFIEFSGCKDEKDKQRFKGRPHDLIVFDEGSDFTETQFDFIRIWNRSTDPDQRCRVLVNSNPPTTAAGLWVIRRWAAWLDRTHPRPAKPGELRWYIRNDSGDEVEVDGPGPYTVLGRQVRARSRTFIRSRLSDNPDLDRTDYGNVLASLPPELRAAYAEGNFDASLRDQEFQVIPTAWIQEAQARWTEDGWRKSPMSAISLDPAGGGDDDAALVVRHSDWIGLPDTKDGEDTKSGIIMASWIISKRTHGCVVVIDAGGGYAGATIERLEDNKIPYEAYNGANGADNELTRDGKLKFTNARSRDHWRLREELDPEQLGGATLALPPDPEVTSDLTAATYRVTSRGIQVESKPDIRSRLGRSPNKGDSIVMVVSPANEAAAHIAARSRPTPNVRVSRAAARRRR